MLLARCDLPWVVFLLVAGFVSAAKPRQYVTDDAVILEGKITLFRVTPKGARGHDHDISGLYVPTQDVSFCQFKIPYIFLVRNKWAERSNQNCKFSKSTWINGAIKQR